MKKIQHTYGLNMATDGDSTKDVTYSRLDVSLRTALLGGDGPTVNRHYRG